MRSHQLWLLTNSIFIDCSVAWEHIRSVFMDHLHVQLIFTLLLGFLNTFCRFFYPQCISECILHVHWKTSSQCKYLYMTIFFQFQILTMGVSKLSIFSFLIICPNEFLQVSATRDVYSLWKLENTVSSAEQEQSASGLMTRLLGQ